MQPISAIFSQGNNFYFSKSPLIYPLLKLFYFCKPFVNKYICYLCKIVTWLLEQGLFISVHHKGMEDVEKKRELLLWLSFHNLPSLVVLCGELNFCGPANKNRVFQFLC